jgi:hypothetical protein
VPSLAQGAAGAASVTHVHIPESTHTRTPLLARRRFPFFKSCPCSRAAMRWLAPLRSAPPVLVARSRRCARSPRSARPPRLPLGRPRPLLPPFRHLGVSSALGAPLSRLVPIRLCSPRAIVQAAGGWRGRAWLSSPRRARRAALPRAALHSGRLRRFRRAARRRLRAPRRKCCCNVGALHRRRCGNSQPLLRCPRRCARSPQPAGLPRLPLSPPHPLPPSPPPLGVGGAHGRVFPSRLVPVRLRGRRTIVQAAGSWQGQAQRSRLGRARRAALPRAALRGGQRRLALSALALWSWRR